MTIYNTSTIDNANTTLQMFSAVNDLSGGWLAAFLLIVSFLVILMVMRNYSFIEQILAASFFSSFLAIILVIINYISWIIAIFPVLMLFGSIVWIMTIER